MTRKNKEEFIDDGRTIADMSNVESRGIFPRGLRKQEKDSGVSKEPLKGKNFWAFLLGATKATFLIALIYIVAFGLVCLIFYLIFRSKM